MTLAAKTLKVLARVQAVRERSVRTGLARAAERDRALQETAAGLEERRRAAAARFGAGAPDADARLARHTERYCEAVGRQLQAMAPEQQAAAEARDEARARFVRSTRKSDLLERKLAEVRKAGLPKP